MVVCLSHMMVVVIDDGGGEEEWEEREKIDHNNCHQTTYWKVGNKSLHITLIFYKNPQRYVLFSFLNIN